MEPTEAKFREELVLLLPRLRRFARALTRHYADADDLVQVALERAMQRRTQWRPELSLYNWMLGIMRHGWIDELRRRRRRELDAQQEAALHQAASPDASHPLVALEVREALERLPQEQRLAVAMVLVDGLSYREAAEIMDVPVGTLTSRLARGRLALAQLLGES